ncbi:arsenate reductase [Alteromonas sediminis]|uniref:Arsenate reductase n=1 Tax=Alteromonas sediminis TaxID=2259342 RepID=A0A3N5YCV8_9ALTE|nr:arsenate reductase [Alteromonas sediminis]RPJ67205.1 arsenate reductase [Alteromonas sediminis]
MTTLLFGISNCDTVKKAKKWLDAHNIDYTFHDFKKDAPTLAWLSQVESAIGWETLLNKRGTTFRKLSDEDKADIDKDKALSLLLEHHSMIKRPVLEHKGEFYCGFSEQKYAEVFA